MSTKAKEVHRAFEQFKEQFLDQMKHELEDYNFQEEYCMHCLTSPGGWQVKTLDAREFFACWLINKDIARIVPDSPDHARKYHGINA